MTLPSPQHNPLPPASPTEKTRKKPEPAFKSGFVAIAGQPNTGKSTFLNAVLGQKIAIVTPKAQTTRTRILGVYHRPHCQIVFLDTPGIHRPGSSKFNRAMVQTAYHACQDVDAVLYFIDSNRGITGEDQTILSRLPRGKAPLFLVMNKVDQLENQKLYARLQSLKNLSCTAVIPLSALNGYNVEHLLSLLPTHLPEGPRYFPDDQWTDQPERFFAAEIIREKLFLYLQKELPYSLAVRLGQFQERPETRQANRQVRSAATGKQKKQDNKILPTLPQDKTDNRIWDMEATILVERDSQKAIVIGHKGSMIKKVGTAARLELERIFGVAIYLQLQVKVRKDWSFDINILRDLGYPTETFHKTDHAAGQQEHDASL